MHLLQPSHQTTSRLQFMHTIYISTGVKPYIFTSCLSGCDHEHMCVCMYLCIHESGDRFGWMSHIVPLRPSGIAGGQRGMEPERGDSDK